MKKFILLILAGIMILGLVACENSTVPNDGTIDSTSDVAAIENETNVGTVESFDKRIEPYTSYIENNAFNYHSENTDYLGFIDANHYVSNASLKKIEDKYVLTLTISAPLMFTDQEVQDMFEKLKTNDTATLSDYTFYKSVDLLKKSFNWDNVYLNLIDNNENKNMLATDSEGRLYLLFEKSNEGLIYKIAALSPAGASGFVVMNQINTIDVELIPDDKMVIKDTAGDELELTVEEYYNRALNKVVENEIVENYTYDLDCLGSFQGLWAEYVDAVSFSDGKVIINHKNGGV